MKIFLRALENFEDSVKKNKTDKQRFPKDILGDFIILHINHPNNEVREITKKVAIRFIDIFGSDILEKMNIYLDEKDIIKTEKELKKIYEKLRKEEKKNVDVSQSYESLFLTNVNKKFPLKQKGRLKPIGKAAIKIQAKDKYIARSSSQPEFNIPKTKFKLKPIKGLKKLKNMQNSNSQKTMNTAKKD